MIKFSTKGHFVNLFSIISEKRNFQPKINQYFGPSANDECHKEKQPCRQTPTVTAMDHTLGEYS